MIFYAHYDKHTGAILSVGGHKLPDDFPEALVTEIDEAMALSFMRYELDMGSWFIGNDGSSVVVTQNMMDLVPHNVGEIMELPRGDNNVMGIRGAAILSEDQVEFTVPPQFKGLPSTRSFDEKVSFILTKRNDPTFVIATFEVDMADLLDKGMVAFDCELELNDYSMFTTKQFCHYQFEVLPVPKNVARKVALTRYNKLVSFKSGPVTSGVVAKHEGNKLTLEIVGKTKLTWPSAERCFLFITKPNDPTIVYHAIPFNVDTFWQDKRVVLQLPDELDQAFGIASFPLSSDLIFNRDSDGNRNKTNH